MKHQNMLIAGAAVLVLALAGGAYAMHNARRDALLVRSDPDALPPELRDFAVARGAALFRANCAACHGPNGYGDPSLGVPDLTDHDWLYGTGRISEIAQTVRYGIRAQDARGRNLADMPAYSHPKPYARENLPPLSPDDIGDVTQYLLALANRPSDEAAAARGEHIYHTRGGCWDCHGQDARGDNEVGSPNLTDRIWLYGDGGADDISRSIADGHAGLCPAFVGRLSEAQIVEVSAYVWSLGGGS